MARSSETIDDGSFGDGDVPGGARMFRRGAELGRYIAIDRVGAGAMGVVLAAFDPERDCKVALKFMFSPPKGDTGEVRDADKLVALSHPNVVAVHEVGTIEGRAFVAMEFVDGLTVRRWLADAERTPGEIVEVFTAAGRGLAAAHAAGLVHRDVKPDNLMIGSDGRVRVMDFGAVEGTPAYTSPEAHAGLPTDARSDQFSFCVALYEALHGRRPFSGASLPELVRNAKAGEFVPGPRSSGVPASIRAAVERGLAADPNARFASMDALIDALAQDPGRSRRIAIAAGIVAVALGVCAIAYEVAKQRRVAACTLASAELGEVWNDSTRQNLPAAAELDDYARAWSEAAATVCRAARVDGSATLEERERSEHCLARGKEQFAAVVEVLAEGDATDRATDVVATLPPAAACADTERLPTADAPVASDELRRGLDRARILTAAGKPDAALVLLEQLDVPADLRVRAEASLLRGDAERAIGLDDDARRSFEAAFFDATRGADDRLVVRAAIGLALVSRDAEALLWIRHAEAALDRDDNREPLLAAELEAARAIVLDEEAGS